MTFPYSVEFFFFFLFFSPDQPTNSVEQSPSSEAKSLNGKCNCKGSKNSNRNLCLRFTVLRNYLVIIMRLMYVKRLR